MTLIEILRNPFVLILISIWEVVWKGISMWKAAKKDRKVWFVALLVINSMGIVPISYILMDKYGYLDKKPEKK